MREKRSFLLEQRWKLMVVQPPPQVTNFAASLGEEPIRKTCDHQHRGVWFARSDERSLDF